MFCFLCTLLLPAMTGARCHRRKDMAALGAQEMGGSAEERPSLANFPAAPPGTSGDSAAFEMDYLTQARKALSERSPFEEEASTSGTVTLPSGLASLLNRHGDNRRRHKKSHSGSEKKTSKASDKPRASNIWVETEEYFRDLTLADIDTLVEASSFSSLGSRMCFLIPVMGQSHRLNVVSSEDGKQDAPRMDLVSGEDEEKSDEDVRNGDCLLGIESVDNVATGNDLLKDYKNGSTSPGSGVSLEWLLGCRSKVSLTSERSSKRRKLLGGDAGLQKLVMTSPCDGVLPVCHYCGRGETGSDLNRLVVCCSCKVAVHQKCYGVQDDVDESWLCSWCKLKSDVDETLNPCVLCPKKGGALKPVNNTVEGAGSVQFVHLFCGLWTREVYIDDLKKMEPVLNAGGIKEARRKLVCNICKLKWGACVQCSHGTCRASFHPLCAREARHRMEVWAKYGDDNVELRAFCLKHSHLQDNRSVLPSGDSIAIGSEFSEANSLPGTLPENSNLSSGCENEGVTSNNSQDKLNHNELQDGGLSDCRLSAQDMSGCGDVQPDNVGVAGRNNENVDTSDSLSFALVLKKLIDRGKVDVKDVAMEIGVSPDTLTANINESCMTPDVLDKIVNWLKAHVYTSAFRKGLKVKFKPPNASKDGSGVTDGSDTITISDSGLLDPVAVKSVPPRRRTVSNIRFVKDNKVICSSEGLTSENGLSGDKFRVGQPDCEKQASSNEASADATEMNLTKSEDIFPKVQGNADKLYKSSIPDCVSEEKSTVSLHNASGSIKVEAISSYIHPYINKKLLQIRNGVLLEDILCSMEEGMSSLVESSGSSGCSSSQNQQVLSIDISNPDRENMEQLDRAGTMGLLEPFPEDEVEGELIYLQYRLLRNAVSRKKFTDNLIYNIAKSLPQEIDAAHQRKWDSVIANQYMRDIREAKKQGRKERRHKEAQAVLAAATAAAAASSRVSSFRKDSQDESMLQNLLKLDTLNGRTGACSQPMPRAKETLSRVAVTRTSSEKYSDFGLPTSDFSKEQPKSCDICRRSESMLNPILVCSGCKVAVHLDCYRSVRETTGPWYCELCEDLSSRSSATSAINFWEKPYFVAECALCGGTSGAFRKSSDGQWVHAFCAEWVLESTFRRGQINAVEGMETALKAVDTCCICHRKHGVCMKCCYGHCRTSFHPSCARSAGFYMNVRTSGSRPQHKAYCEKHSLEQKAKSESQKHGIEEFKSMKQIRVELERVRLLCERIVKREKIKRELVLCSHDILAFKRDHVARSVLVRSPFILPDGSSESATTSLKANTDGYRSCSEAVQRSDDITVDSSVSAKRRVRVAVSMDADPKLDDDCSTSQSHYNRKIPERMQFSGKQIPRRVSATSCNLADEGGLRSKSRKHADTFGKEIVMTSDEASMKNLKLPKGYAYVRADCLSKDKQSNDDE